MKNYYAPDSSTNKVNSNAETSIYHYLEKINRLLVYCAEPLEAGAYSHWLDVPEPYATLLMQYISLIDACAELIRSWFPVDSARVFDYYQVIDNAVKGIEKLRLPVTPSYWMNLQEIYYYIGKASEISGNLSLREEMAQLLAKVNDHKNDNHVHLLEEFSLK